MRTAPGDMTAPRMRAAARIAAAVRVTPAAVPTWAAAAMMVAVAATGPVRHDAPPDPVASADLPDDVVPATLRRARALSDGAAPAGASPPGRAWPGPPVPVEPESARPRVFATRCALAAALPMGIEARGGLDGVARRLDGGPGLSVPMPVVAQVGNGHTRLRTIPCGHARHRMRIKRMSARVQRAPDRRRRSVAGWTVARPGVPAARQHRETLAEARMRTLPEDIDVALDR